MSKPVQQSRRLPVDLFIALLIVLAFAFGILGRPVMGGLLAFLSLAAYLVYLGVERSPSLLYRPQFKHWFWFLGVWLCVYIFAGKFLGQQFRPFPAIAIGALAYHYTCICLFERTVRYGSWGARYFSGWTTIHGQDSPTLFWTFIGLFAFIGIGMLLLPFVLWIIQGYT